MEPDKAGIVAIDALPGSVPLGESGVAHSRRLPQDPCTLVPDLQGEAALPAHPKIPLLKHCIETIGELRSEFGPAAQPRYRVDEACGAIQRLIWALERDRLEDMPMSVADFKARA